MAGRGGRAGCQDLGQSRETIPSVSEAGGAAGFWKLCPGLAICSLRVQEAVRPGQTHGRPWPALLVYRRGRERLREAE